MGWIEKHRIEYQDGLGAGLPAKIAQQNHLSTPDPPAVKEGKIMPPKDDLDDA